VDPDSEIPVYLSDLIRIQGFDDHKLRKNTAEKYIYFLFLIKNCNLLTPRPSALKREHPESSTSKNESY
jgi:hypothetical protein